MTHGANTPEPTIATLEKAIDHVQILSDAARDKGDFAKAQTLTAQATTLVEHLAALRAKRRGRTLKSADWQKLNQGLDDLQGKADQAEKAMQDADETVETVKSVVGLAGKLATAL